MPGSRSRAMCRVSFARSLAVRKLERPGRRRMDNFMKWDGPLFSTAQYRKPVRMADGILALLVLVASCCVPAAAQQLLQGADITESALVEALTPAPAPVLTRSLTAAPAAAPKPAKAALLITFETNAKVLT